MHTKWWGYLFGTVLSAELLLFVVAPAVGWWLPKNVSSFGSGVDMLFYVILAVTGFFFILTESILVYNMVCASGHPGEKSPYSHGNHKLEMVWSIIPGALLLLLAIVQIKVWAEIKYPSEMKPEKDNLQIEITARQWEWRLRYPSSDRLESWLAGGVGSDAEKDMRAFSSRGFDEEFHNRSQFDDVHLVNELHVINGTKTLIHLKTRDILHSFFLPNFRLKQDALPAKTIPVWFKAEDYNTVKFGDEWVSGHDPKKAPERQKEYDAKYKAALEKDMSAVELVRANGANDEIKKLKEEAAKLHVEAQKIKGLYDVDYTWELPCAEYCGTRHSMMRGVVYVHKDRADFLEWLKSAQKAQLPK